MKAWTIKRGNQYWDDLEELWGPLCYATLYQLKRQADNTRLANHLVAMWKKTKSVKVNINESGT